MREWHFKMVLGDGLPLFSPYCDHDENVICGECLKEVAAVWGQMLDFFYDKIETKEITEDEYRKLDIPIRKVKKVRRA